MSSSENFSLKLRWLSDEQKISYSKLSNLRFSCYVYQDILFQKWTHTVWVTKYASICTEDSHFAQDSWAFYCKIGISVRN